MRPDVLGADPQHQGHPDGVSAATGPGDDGFRWPFTSLLSFERPRALENHRKHLRIVEISAISLKKSQILKRLDPFSSRSGLQFAVSPAPPSSLPSLTRPCAPEADQLQDRGQEVSRPALLWVCGAL